jgi:hypothetical protein
MKWIIINRINTSSLTFGAFDFVTVIGPAGAFNT